MNGVNYIEDEILSINTKRLITEYCDNNETHSTLDCTFKEIFDCVWKEINSFDIDIQIEIKNRLNEEMTEANCMCYTGRISRLINCLSGFSDKVSIELSDAEQIGNIISIARSKLSKFNDVQDIINFVRNELEERNYSEDIINQWISYIE